MRFQLGSHDRSELVFTATLSARVRPGVAVTASGWWMDARPYRRHPDRLGRGSGDSDTLAEAE